MTLAQKRALRFGLRLAAMAVLLFAFTAIAFQVFSQLPMGDSVVVIGHHAVRQAALLVAMVAVIGWAVTLTLFDIWIARRLGLPIHDHEHRGD